MGFTICEISVLHLPSWLHLLSIFCSVYSCLDWLVLDRGGHSGVIFPLGRGILLSSSEGDLIKHERLLRGV